MFDISSVSHADIFRANFLSGAVPHSVFHFSLITLNSGVSTCQGSVDGCDGNGHLSIFTWFPTVDGSCTRSGGMCTRVYCCGYHPVANKSSLSRRLRNVGVVFSEGSGYCFFSVMTCPCLAVLSMAIRDSCLLHVHLDAGSSAKKAFIMRVDLLIVHVSDVRCCGQPLCFPHKGVSAMKTGGSHQHHADSSILAWSREIVSVRCCNWYSLIEAFL